MPLRRNDKSSNFSTYMGIPFLIVKSLTKFFEKLAFAVFLVFVSLQLIKLCIKIDHLSKGVERQELVL